MGTLTTAVDLLTAFGLPFALIAGALLGVRFSRGGHYRQCCPATAWPTKLARCSCRCKACKRSECVSSL